MKYTEEELREIESKDQANLCEDGPYELVQQQEYVCLRSCFAFVNIVIHTGKSLTICLLDRQNGRLHIE